MISGDFEQSVSVLFRLDPGNLGSTTWGMQMQPVLLWTGHFENWPGHSLVTIDPSSLKLVRNPVFLSNVSIWFFWKIVWLFTDPNENQLVNLVTCLYIYAVRRNHPVVKLLVRSGHIQLRISNSSKDHCLIVEFLASFAYCKSHYLKEMWNIPFIHNARLFE